MSVTGMNILKQLYFFWGTIQQQVPTNLELVFCKSLLIQTFKMSSNINQILTIVLIVLKVPHTDSFSTFI